MVITNTVLILATVLMGEAGVLPEGMELIGHCVMNRVASPDFPDTVAEVLAQPWQFNGRTAPSSLAMYWARLVLRREHDPTGGVLFVLSGADRDRLGCPVGDVVYVGGEWSLHGYREWCQ